MQNNHQTVNSILTWQVTDKDICKKISNKMNKNDSP